MDLLKEEKGTTILETLVVILLLGILVKITTAFYSNIISNRNMLKTDALWLAKQEISRVLNEKPGNDTTYYNASKNLRVERNIYQNDLLNTIKVSISRTGNDSLILVLTTKYKNETSK